MLLSKPETQKNQELTSNPLVMNSKTLQSLTWGDPKKQFDNKKLKISLKMQTDGDLESIVETAIALMREKERDTHWIHYWEVLFVVR